MITHDYPQLPISEPLFSVVLAKQKTKTSAMEILKELVTILGQNKVKNIEVIGNAPAKQSLTKVLYGKLANERCLTDRKAAKAIYNSDEHDKKYRILKNKLTERLINTLFFVDTKKAKYDSRTAAQANCWKYLVAAKLLAQQSAYKSMLFLLEKTIKIGHKFDLTEIVMDASKMLMEYYSQEVQDAKKFEHYYQLFKQQLNRYCAENQAAGLLGKVVVNSNLPNILDLTEQFLEELKAVPVENKNAKFQLVQATLRIMKYELLGAPNEVIKVCQSKTEHFSEGSAFQFKMLIKQYQCLIQLNDFDSIAGVEAQIETFISIGSKAWFTYHYEKIKYLIKQHQYQEAFRVFRVVYLNRRFPFLDPIKKERYYLMEGYFAFLFKLGKIDAPNFKQKRFRMYKLINSVPYSVKDKKGYNVQLLVLTWLHLLAEKQYGTLIDKMEGTKQYINRYLRTIEQQRSADFLKAILCIPLGHFKRGKVLELMKEKGNSLEEGVSKGRLMVQRHEIIPFNDLWALILEVLD